MVDFKFSDLAGRWHHVTVPRMQLDDAAAEGRIGFDGSSVGLKSVKAGDMVLMPDSRRPSAIRSGRRPTLSFICSAFEADTKTAVRARSAQHRPARRAGTCARPASPTRAAGGRSTSSTSSTTSPSRTTSTAASYRVDSREADWQSGTGGHGHLIPLHGGYHAIPPKDQLYNLRSEMALVLEEMGVAGEVPPPRGRRARAVRDRDADDGPAASRRRHADRQVRHQDDGASAQADGDLHAQAALRRSRQRHALPPTPARAGGRMSSTIRTATAS